MSYDAGVASVVPVASPQEESDRTYFRDALRLLPGQITMSPLDPNVEQSAPEVPRKPTIRIATAVSDGSGRNAGIVVIHYLAAIMLARLKLASQGVPGDLMLLNREGYRLAAPDTRGEWGFMVREREERTIGTRFPEAARRIHAAQTGQFGPSAEGLFTFDTVFPLLEGGTGAARASEVNETDRTSSYLWKIVSRVPQDTIARVEAP